MFQCIDCIDIASAMFAFDGFTIVITPMTDAKWYQLWLWRINFLSVLILRCTRMSGEYQNVNLELSSDSPSHPTREIQISFPQNPKKSNGTMKK